MDNRLAGPLGHLGIKKDYKKDSFLFSSGDPACGFFYVLSGQIRVLRESPEGREIEIARFGPGDFLGEIILFSNDRFPVTAQAAAPSKAVFFPKETILSEIRKNPETALFFLKLLSGKCQILARKVESLGLQNIRDRLIRYLAGRCPDKGRFVFDLPVKKTDLARQLGTIPETLSRNFRELENEKLIKVAGRRISVPDCEKLRR